MAFYDVVVLYEDAFEESKGGRDRGTFQIRRSLLAKSDTPDPSFVAIGTSTATWPGLGGEAIDQLNATRNFDGILAICRSRKFSWYKGTENGVKIDLVYEGISPYVNDEGGGSEEPRTIETVTWRRISMSTSQMTIPATDGATEDRDDGGNRYGVSFCNSAGDPVDGLEMETAIAQMTYTNEFNPNPNLSRIFYWLNRCNSSAYLGAPAYTLRVTGFSAEFDDQSMLWKTSIEMTFNPKGWHIDYYDAGYNEIVFEGGSYKRKAILDERGNPVSTPVPLNGNGQQAVIEAPISLVAAKGVSKTLTQGAMLRAEPYPKGDFSLLLRDLRMY